MKNKGKEFEGDFRSSAAKQDLWIMRINDTFYNAKKADPNAFVPQQACDYLVHNDGILYLMELKSTKEKYITIERDGKNGMIKKHQYDQMSKLNTDKERGILILQFERESNQKTLFLYIEDFMRFLEENDKKSINASDVLRYGGSTIPQMKARTHWWYNVKKILTI